MTSLFKASILLLLALPFFCSKLNAQTSSSDWIFVAKGDDNTAYITSTYVSKDESKIKLWTKWVYKTPYTYKDKKYNDFWSKQLTIWDCKEKRYKTLVTVYYTNNEAIDSYISDKEWSNVNSNTLGEDIIKMVDLIFN